VFDNLGFDASAHDYKTRNNVLIQIVTELLSGSHSYAASHPLSEEE
jgi:hypothetical protein